MAAHNSSMPGWLSLPSSAVSDVIEGIAGFALALGEKPDP